MVRTAIVSTTSARVTSEPADPIAALRDPLARIRAATREVLVHPEQRRRWLTVANFHHAEPHLIVFDVPLEVALKRNRTRPHPVPAARIIAMRDDFAAALDTLDSGTEPWASITDANDALDTGDIPDAD